MSYLPLLGHPLLGRVIMNINPEFVSEESEPVYITMCSEVPSSFVLEFDVSKLQELFGEELNEN
jgi:hypothetical protein